MKPTRHILLNGVFVAAVMAAASSAQAQQINGTPGSPSATVTIDGEQIPLPPPPCKSEIERLCPNVEFGGGRIKACLMAQKEELTVGCAEALQKLEKMK